MPFHNLGKNSCQDFIVEFVNTERIEMTQETSGHIISTTTLNFMVKIDNSSCLIVVFYIDLPGGPIAQINCISIKPIRDWSFRSYQLP